MKLQISALIFFMNLSFGWRDRRPAFRFPTPIDVRTVVFQPLFKSSSNLLYVDPLGQRAAAEIRTFGPASIAGTFEVVLKFAAGAQPTHCLVIFTHQGETCLRDDQREALWKACQVPIFEQVIAENGRLAAWECEAHDGLHLLPGAQAAPGGAVETRACNCGVTSSRVLAAARAPAFTSGREVSTPQPPGRLVSATRPIPT